MDNYQLYKSNIFLGGQMKWDLVVEAGKDGLYINNFFLTPISEYAPFRFIANKNLLNYSHLDNIKSFYKENTDIFYKEYANPLLTATEPFLYKDEYKKSTRIEIHNSVMEIGLKRSKYSKYNKQFEFFCPIWLEQYEKDNLYFKIIVKSNTDKILFYKNLYIKQLDQDYHNKFVNYFNNYLTNIQLGNQLINIDLKNNKSYITGIDVSTGLYTVKDISKLTYNILLNERLMMDFDNLICQEYPDNHMITPQLLNLNFIFDLEEIIPKNMINDMYGNDLCMDIVVIYNNEELSRKDFYTNYDFIKSKSVNNSTDDNNVNIFDIIKDDKSLVLKHKNKISQNIFHWSLYDNNDYIFNLYTGFGGYINYKTTKSKCSTGLKINDPKVKPIDYLKKNFDENNHIYNITDNIKYDLEGNIIWDELENQLI